MDLVLTSLHASVRIAQIDKDAAAFNKLHRMMVSTLQKKLTKNIKQKTNECKLFTCEKEFKPNLLLEVLVEYRDMDLTKHSNLKKYKFKKSDKIFKFK